MTWSPASSRSATNGVVFQMSTADTDASAVFGCEIQATEWWMMWSRIKASLMTPKTSSYIHFHICAETTVGIAQGTSMTARMTPRPLKFELTTSAMTRPRTNSNETVISVNLTVSMIEFLKSLSWIRPFL